MNWHMQQSKTLTFGSKGSLFLAWGAQYLLANCNEGKEDNINDRAIWEH